MEEEAGEGERESKEGQGLRALSQVRGLTLRTARLSATSTLRLKVHVSLPILIWQYGVQSQQFQGAKVFGCKARKG